jgi:hypothetical protein
MQVVSVSAKALLLSQSRAALAALALAGGVAACQGCHPTGRTGGRTGDVSKPTVRLYLASDLAGALEPCGCTKDQLGGMTHAAAWISSERQSAPFSALVTSGPLFFLDPALKPDHAEQDTSKAETIAASLKLMGLVGFAAGANDWAGGAGELSSLAAKSGGAFLQGDATLQKGTLLREMNGVKVGVIGVGASVPAIPGDPLADIHRPAPDAVRAAYTLLKKQGADLVVLLAAVGRGEAKRIADAVPELTAIVVGAGSSTGEGNTSAPPAERVGDVIVAQTSNHLQTLAALDLYVRGDSFKFADASGLEESRKREDLVRRIDELHVKIAVWVKDGKIAPADLDARRADLARLEAERAALDQRPPPAEGSFFRYTVKEIRDSLGSDPGVAAELGAYYKKVNERNKVLFADRLPPPAAPGQPSYVGIEVCTACHDSARTVWDKTRHAHAYATLADQDKQFNLDCVSCHVTGYEAPGGSTVTHVDLLKDVECEVCHGPGSLHSKTPKKYKPVVSKPSPDSCLSCHHPPHVEGFDAKAKMEEILGPGHGKPD